MINPSSSLDFLGELWKQLVFTGLAGKALALQIRFARALITRTRRGGSLAVDISSGQLLRNLGTIENLAKLWPD